MKEQKGEKMNIGEGAIVTRLEFGDPRLFRDLLGQHDEHLKMIQRSLGVRIHIRGSAMEIEGDPVEVELSTKVIRQLYGLLEKGYPVYGSDLDYAIRILSGDGRANLQDIFLDTIYISSHKRVITPKSVAQKAYIDAIRRYDIVFGIGPAGTGKTYLAMAMAVAELMKNNYVRIILTRPAVEAGGKKGGGGSWGGEKKRGAEAPNNRAPLSHGGSLAPCAVRAALSGGLLLLLILSLFLLCF